MARPHLILVFAMLLILCLFMLYPIEARRITEKTRNGESPDLYLVPITFATRPLYFFRVSTNSREVSTRGFAKVIELTNNSVHFHSLVKTQMFSDIVLF